MGSQYVYAHGGMVNYILSDYILVMVISAYCIAFFGGHIKHSKRSPTLTWINNNYPGVPKYFVYIGIFVLSFKAIGLIKYLL